MPVVWWMLATRGWACEPSALQVRQMLPPDGQEGVPHNILPAALLGEGMGEEADYDLHVEDEGGSELDVTTLRFLYQDGSPNVQGLSLTALLDTDLAPDASYRYWVEDATGAVLGESQFTTGPESLTVGIPTQATLQLGTIGDVETAETDCDYAESRLFELEITPSWADVHGIGSVEIYLTGSEDLVAVVDVTDEPEATITVPVRLPTSVADPCFQAVNVAGGLTAPATGSVCYDAGFDTDYRSDPDYPANREYGCGCGSGGGGAPLLAVAALALLGATRRRGGAA